MDESAFKGTPVAIAFFDYLSFFVRTIEFFDVGKRGLKLINLLSPIFANSVAGMILGAQRRVQAIKTHQMGQREVDDNFEFFAALMLLSSWAAFEAYIDDVCIAMLHLDPALLVTGNLARVKLSQDESQLGDHAKFSLYLRKGANYSKATTAVEKIERQLELVGMNGVVPPDLTDNVNTSKLIRNVWAHKAGKADQYFVDNCATTSFPVGDTVAVTKEALYSFLVGMATLAVVVVNRFRVKNGMPPMETYPGSAETPNTFKLSVDQLFPNPVSWDVLGTTP